MVNKSAVLRVGNGRLKGCTAVNLAVSVPQGHVAGVGDGADVTLGWS